MDNQQELGILRGRYRVLLQQALPHLNSGENLAYRAEDIRDPNNVVFALVLAPGIPFREKVVEALTGKSLPGIIDLHSHGVVQFDSSDFRYVFIFEFPSGGPVFTEGRPLNEQQVLNVIVPKLVDLIINFSSREITHRNIRADNIYFLENEKAGIALGDCVSLPPATLQPAVYEPVESANSLPDGRGDGNIMADIYALGVLIVHMLGGIVPGQGKSANELYAAKLQHGTYAVLVPKIPASSRVSFLLAGLLNDDPYRRWNIEVLIRWRDGVYERPRPGFGDRQAPGPIIFEGKDYLSPRLLALAMTRRPAQAYTLLESGKVESWVRNSLNDKEASRRVGDAVRNKMRGGGGSKRIELQCVSRVSAILDNRGAFWYREATFSRRGLGSLLASAFRSDGPLKSAIAEMLESGVLLDAVYSDLDQVEAGRRKDNSWIALGKATDCFEYMEKREKMGYGIERCLYELNPSLGCMSTTLQGSYVRKVENLLDVLEERAFKTDGKINPFDRHIAAFIASRTKFLSKNFQKLGNLPQGGIEYTLLLITMFGRMQSQLSPSPKPGLCLWVKRLLNPVIGKIHSEIRREFVKKKLEKAIESGNIEKILGEIDLMNNIRRDADEYEQAIKEFKYVSESISLLENGGKARELAAKKYGQWIASVISIAALLSSMGFSYLYFLGS
ncbi:hypothetical protein [Sneathiella limimaris]|uniref:hypothetical protein n=1 Tax=Sneathiella limimaris TaxID=1964213 RepID=UPI00146EC005|nr:hypothetical protein [Sneathiella limimaris]